MEKTNTRLSELKTHRKSMQENEVERTRNTNLEGGSFASIVWVLELIDRTLVYGIFLLKAESEDRGEFSRKKIKQNSKRKGMKGRAKGVNNEAYAEMKGRLRN